MCRGNQSGILCVTTATCVFVRCASIMMTVRLRTATAMSEIKHIKRPIVADRGGGMERTLRTGLFLTCQMKNVSLTAGIGRMVCLMGLYHLPLLL